MKKTIFLMALAMALFCSAIRFISGSEARTASGHTADGSFAQPQQPQIDLSIGETVVQVYAIGPWGLSYVNPEDDPRNQKR